MAAVGVDDVAAVVVVDDDDVAAVGVDDDDVAAVGVDEDCDTGVTPDDSDDKADGFMYTRKLLLVSLKLFLVEHQLQVYLYYLDLVI